MTTPTFKEPTTETETTHRYSLSARQALADDHKRLSELAKEIGLAPQDWGYLALEEVARYRDAMRAYRDALVAMGHLPEIPSTVPLWLPL